MKKNTVVIPLLALTLLAGGIFAAPHAQSADANVDSKKTENVITDAQRAEAHKAVEASQTKIQPLRQALFVKKEELKALQNAATPDVNAVSQKAKEITVLQAQVQDEKEKLGIALDKALGLEPGTHAMRKMHGMHDGKGRGCGYGHRGGKMHGEGRGHGEGYGKGHGQNRGHGQGNHGGGMHQMGN